VIVPADELVEPIIAFVEKGIYDPSEENPLGAMVSRDVPARIAAVRSQQPLVLANEKKLTGKRAALQNAMAGAKRKWTALQTYNDAIGTTGETSISDVRVAPLVQSKWSQRGVWIFEGGEPVEYVPIYNYYTPGPYYPCGCLATAMTQLMRYHEYPTAGVGTPSFTIHVDGVEQTASLRGGNGSGQPYVWSDMVLEPDVWSPEYQRQAISGLCYDAGVSINMYYTSSGSSAGMWKIPTALVETFGYSNAVIGMSDFGDIGLDLNGMINPNLDANLPVIVSARNNSGGMGHAIVCDGYGYDSSTLYHHLNMGWSGNYDAWYALPDVGTIYGFDIITGCVYNIFTSGSGEMISGRVTNSAEVPVTGAIVSAHICGGTTYYTTTDSRGIYVLANLPSETEYFVNAAQTGLDFNVCRVCTGSSNNSASFSGNVWGVDFQGSVSAGSVDLEKETYVAPEGVRIRVVDDDLRGNGSEQVLVKICGGDTETVTLTEYPSDSGVFTGDIACAEGAAVEEDGTIQVMDIKRLMAIYQDSNDGSGRSATLHDTATLANVETVIYQTDFAGGLPVGWSVVDGYTDGSTWNSDNLGGRTSEYWTGTFMIVDRENPYTIEMDEELISHVLDCSDYEKVTLTFSHDFDSEYDEICEVDIRVDGGQWQSAARYQGADACGVVEVDLSSIAAGQSNVQVRWHYYKSLFSLYWGIDDVKVSGVMPPEGILGQLEPDCEINFRDFAIFASEWLKVDCGDCGGADFTGNGAVGVEDLGEFAKEWLAGFD
jgi:hypothetical protein